MLDLTLEVIVKSSYTRNLGVKGKHTHTNMLHK